MTGEDYLKRRDLHPFYDESRDPNKEDVVDAFEQGKAEGNNELLAKAWSRATITDWYINSVSSRDEPIWTDVHIEELCKDFILIKKGE